MSTVVETSRISLLENPHRFALSDVLLRACPKNDIAGSTSILLLYLLYHLQQTLKRIKVSWDGIDIEQVAVAVDEPVLE
jgi:hypothetical protein